MKKFLTDISKSILYFFGGVFFSLFIITVIVVVILYNENTRLRNEINRINNRVINTEPEPEVKRIIPDNVFQEPEEENPPSANPTPVRRGIRWENWNNLKRNMTANEVTNLLGNPTQVISKIDTTKYIYKDGRNEGVIDFNRLMRVITWNR